MKLHALPRTAGDQPPHAGATSRLLSSRAASHLHIQEAAEGTELPLAGLLTSAGTVIPALWCQQHSFPLTSPQVTSVLSGITTSTPAASGKQLPHVRGTSGDQPPQATGCHTLRASGKLPPRLGHPGHTTTAEPQATICLRQVATKHGTTGEQPPQAVHSHLQPCAPQHCRQSVKAAAWASPKEGFYFSFHTCKAGLGVSCAGVAKPRGRLPLPSCRATTRPAPGSPHKRPPCSFFKDWGLAGAKGSQGSAAHRLPPSRL